MRFSFWMANNAPFTERERLVLLRMHSVLERLIFIWKAVDRLSKQESVICCTQCKSRFTTVTDIFTVAGAEGTTAAYVNDHGCIHQITTLRTIDERKVLFHGSPSTDNRYVAAHAGMIRCHACVGWHQGIFPYSRGTACPEMRSLAQLLSRLQLADHLVQTLCLSFGVEVSKSANSALVLISP